MLPCSTPPHGRSRWTLQLLALADKMVELQYINTISDQAVHDTLKKTNLSLGRRRSSGAYLALPASPMLASSPRWKMCLRCTVPASIQPSQTTGLYRREEQGTAFGCGG